MTTHREQLADKLHKTFPMIVNATKLTVEHLLVFADMLDEREADQFRDATKGEPTSAGHFNDALVERLARLSFDAQMHDDDVRAMAGGSWEAYSPHLKASGLIGLRAILSELASMPCDLPTPEKMCSYAQRQGFSGIKYDDARAVHELVRAHVAPILAAKDATIRALVAEAERDAEKTLAIRVEREQYEKTIELQKAQLANAGHGLERLQRVVAELEARETEYQQLYVPLKNASLPRVGTALVAQIERERNAYKERITELEKRIAELTAPMVVDGKTPGQVNREVFEWATMNHHKSKGVDRWAIAANAVLRAFGNGVEALKRTKEAVGNVELRFIGAASGARLDRTARDAIRDVKRIIDAEIANIGEAGA